MSPEYAMLGHFSEKSNISSFGVMILEIISGKRNTDSYDQTHGTGDSLLCNVSISYNNLDKRNCFLLI